MTSWCRLPGSLPAFVHVAWVVVVVAVLDVGSASAQSYEGYDETEEERTGPRRDSPQEEDGSVQAGGLTAPGALDETGQSPSEIEQELERSDREDSGRGLSFIWARAELGLQSADLTALGEGARPLLPGVSSGATGLVAGGAAGVRLLYFTGGLHFRIADLGPLQLWSLTGELGLRVPLGNVEPFFGLGAGYTALAGHGAAGSLNASDVEGADIRVLGGVDYFFGDYFSVGAGLSGDVLFLTRSANADLGVEGGAGVGAAFSATALLGFHF